jgi:thiamine pyrophosphokinase
VTPLDRAADAPGATPPSTGGPPRHVLVVAGGDAPDRGRLDRAWPGWAADIAEVVAADGGLDAAVALGLAPAVLVGDLDSADPGRIAAAEAGGVRVARSSPEKDESDTELAVLEAVGLGASRITILGALGGERFDHALANVWLLMLDALADVPTALLDERVRVTLLTGPAPDGRPAERRLPGVIGATVTLLPFAEVVEGVTTRDLRYPLRDEPLHMGPARGLSNVRTGEDAAVSVRIGRLLIVEAASPAGGLCSDS